MRKYVVEAVGAIFLVMVFGFTGSAIAVGLVLSALVYTGAHVSGAHYNPAVSLAFFIKGKLSFKQFIGYVSSQLLGAFIAALVIYFFSSSVFYIEPPYDTSLYQQAGAELIFSTLFVWVMLAFMLSPALKDNKVYGFAIGLTFTGCLLAGSSISGGVFNPVIAAGPALFDLLMEGDSYQYLILYTLTPLTGGALAAALHTYLDN